MVPLLDDVAVLHDQDQVRVTDGGQTMGDDEAGAPLDVYKRQLLHRWKMERCR